MTIEASLLAIAEQAAALTKAVDANTTNPGMTTVLERLIKALDRNTNVHLAKSGEPTTMENKQEAETTGAGEIPANLKRGKGKPDAAKAAAKPTAKAEAKAPAKIEYAQLSQKALDLMAKHGKPLLLAFLADRALSNLKQAHVDDYEEINAALDAELAKDAQEELT
ncbi:MAG: hypothetical protein ABL936_00310 [Aestuariivirga sp.]